MSLLAIFPATPISFNTQMIIANRHAAVSKNSSDDEHAMLCFHYTTTYSKQECHVFSTRIRTEICNVAFPTQMQHSTHVMQ